MKPPPDGHSTQHLSALALIATAALWGSNHVVARAVHDTVALPALVFWRWLIAAAALTIVALPAILRCRTAIEGRLGELLVGGAIGVGAFSFFLLGGAYLSPALEVGIINATTPIWVLLLGMWSGATISGQPLVGLALAFGGTLLIIGKGQLAHIAGLHFSLGNLCSLVGAITFAWFSVRARTWSRSVEPLALTVVTAWSGVVLVMLPVYVLSILGGGPWLVTDASAQSMALTAVLFVAIGPTMLGNLFYLYGVSNSGAQRAAIYLYLSPVFSTVAAVMFLGETFAWFHAVGVALIFAGLWLVQRIPASGAR